MAYRYSSQARAAGQRKGAHPARSRASSEDDYLSDDDELSESDMNILNTDDSFQREPAFHHIPASPYPTGSPNNLSSEKYDEAFDMPGGPPRNGSLTHHETISHHGGYHIPHYRVPPRKYHAYQYPQSRPRPLIDYIKNEWQQAALNTSSNPTPQDHFDRAISILQVLSAPRIQRLVLAFSAFLFFMWCNWKAWIGPRFSESHGLQQSASERIRNAEGWFGENLRPEFVNMAQVDTLDESFLPGGPNVHDERRLIIIGDVHGCNDERKSESRAFTAAITVANQPDSQCSPHHSRIQTKDGSPHFYWRPNSERAQLCRCP